MFRALSQRFKTISSANSVSFSSENKTYVHGRKERERETTGISYRDMNVCMWIWYPVSLISYDVNSIKYLESTIVVYAYLFILCVHTCTYIYIYVCVLDWTYWNRAPLFSHCFKAAGLISAEHPDRLQQLTFACTQLSGALPLDAQRLQHTCLMQSHLQCARLEATKMSMLLASWKFQACGPY